jgi:hypothetical protein
MKTYLEKNQQAAIENRIERLLDLRMDSTKLERILGFELSTLDQSFEFFSKQMFKKFHFTINYYTLIIHFVIHVFSTKSN